MGNGLFNPPPPTDGAPLVDVPVTDFVQQAKDTTQGQKEGHWYDFFWLSFWKSVKEGIIKVIGFFVGGLDDVIAIALSGVSAAQGTGQPGMLKLMGAVMEDLLAIPIEGDEFIAAFQKGGRLGSMRKAGGKLMDILAGEMAPAAGNVTINPGQEGASGFLGFLIEFAVRQGNLAVIAELIPEEFNFMGGLREYGEILAKNLGLGRLARLALRPLITTLVADPLQWSLNQKYTPKLLSEHDAVRLFTEGLIDGGMLQTTLAKWGYSEPLHNLLTLSAYKKLTLDDLYNLAKASDGSLLEPTLSIHHLGYDPGAIPLVWKSTRQTHIDPLVHAYLTEVKAQFKEGIIDVSQRDAILAEMPLSEDERTWWVRIMANAPVSHVRHLSEGELERAYLEGIIDLSQIQGTWQRYGYTADGIQTLTFLLLAKKAGGTTTSAGHKAIKHLTEAELEKAYHGGLMTLAAVQAYWTLLGYSAADVTTLTGLIQLPPKAPAVPTIAPAAAP